MTSAISATVSKSNEGAEEAVNAIGAAIRRARGSLSIQQLARMTHMSAAHISMLESGKRPDPQFTTVLKIARALGISLDELTASVSVDVDAKSDTVPFSLLQMSDTGPATVQFLNEKINFTQRYLETLKDLVLAMADALEATKAPAVNQILEALAAISRDPGQPAMHDAADAGADRLRQPR